MRKYALTLLFSFLFCSGIFAQKQSGIFGSGKVDDLLSGLKSTVENATSSSEFSIDRLQGNWKYVSPAVQFDTDDALKKLGGAAAATAVENKLSPYYNRVGLNNLTMSVDSLYNFTIKIKYGTLKGKVEKGTDGKLVFNFQTFGKIKIGKVNCMASMSGGILNLAFDAKRFIDIIQKVSSVSGNSSFQTISSILKSYDGIHIGVKLKK